MYYFYKKINYIRNSKGKKCPETNDQREVDTPPCPRDCLVGNWGLIKGENIVNILIKL